MPFNKQSFVNEESECNKYEDFPIDSRMFLKRKTKSKSVELKTNGSSDFLKPLSQLFSSIEKIKLRALALK